MVSVVSLGVVSDGFGMVSLRENSMFIVVSAWFRIFFVVFIEVFSIAVYAIIHACVSLQAIQFAAISASLCLENRDRALSGLASSSSPCRVHSLRHPARVAAAQPNTLRDSPMTASRSALKNFSVNRETLALPPFPAPS